MRARLFDLGLRLDEADAAVLTMQDKVCPLRVLQTCRFMVTTWLCCCTDLAYLPVCMQAQSEAPTRVLPVEPWRVGMTASKRG